MVLDDGNIIGYEFVVEWNYSENDLEILELCTGLLNEKFEIVDVIFVGIVRWFIG